MKTNLEDLWEKFGSNLKLFILKKVQDEDVAEDILQEVFIKIHTRVDQLKDQTKIQAWIYRIARNLIIDYFRGIQKSKTLQPEYEEFTEEMPEDFMSESIADMVKMMSVMPPEYCEALCETELRGLSQKAYAEKIGISYTAAKSRVQRGRKILKDMLMNCCHYQFDKYGTVIGIHPIQCCCCSKKNNKMK